MASKSDWAGRVGQEWARRVADMEDWLGPPGLAGLTALGKVRDVSVLDVGCGAGASSRWLAAEGAGVVGVDVSADLLAVAKAASGAAYRLADAAEDDLGGPYDAIYSRFGAMFFDDPEAGWSHIRGHMRTDAKGVIVAWRGWDENPWTALPAQWMTPILGEDVMAPSVTGVPGPFAWGDADYAKAVLAGAGWRDVALTPWTQENVLSMGTDPDPAVRAAKATMTISPVASRLKDASEAQLSAVRQELVSRFRDYVRGDAVWMKASVWIITMRA